jgi:hypothetical protein
MDAITTGLGKLDIQKNDNLHAIRLAQGFWKKPAGPSGMRSAYKNCSVNVEEFNCQQLKPY